jgi:hypothetical protein
MAPAASAASVVDASRVLSEPIALAGHLDDGGVRCWTSSRRSPVASAWAKSAAKVEGAAHERAVAGPDGPDGDGRGDLRFADARWSDLEDAPCVATKRALANSTIFVFGIFGSKVH